MFFFKLIFPNVYIVIRHSTRTHSTFYLHQRTGKHIYITFYLLKIYNFGDVSNYLYGWINTILFLLGLYYIICFGHGRATMDYNV